MRLTEHYPRSALEPLSSNAAQAYAITHYDCRTTRYATWLVRAILAASAIGIFWSLT